MADEVAAVRVTAIGYWLPCDQVSFFHHEDDRDLLLRHQLARQPEGTQERLDSTVFRRLVTVLPDKGYTHVFPVYHVAHPGAGDPDAAVFVHGNPADLGVPVGLDCDAVVLVVSAAGFCLWVALYKRIQGNLAQSPGSADLASAADEASIQAALRDHVENLVGGRFYSHFAGWPEEEDLVSKEERDESLKVYRDVHKGILAYFQINTIMEGLFNSTLDFRVFFFGSAGFRQDAVQSAKKEYSLGRFFEHISALLSASDLSHPDERPQPRADVVRATPSVRDALDAGANEQLAALFTALLDAVPHSDRETDSSSPLPSGLGDNQAQWLAQALCRRYLTQSTESHLLRRFLHVTSAETLLELKHRLERCRRALLAVMIEVTHRQQPLIQAEVPDVTHDRIEGVNEAQLRGYIMLFAAKLPLIANVRLYLEELALDDDEKKVREEVSAAYATWMILFQALENDVHGLEQAVEQARLDAMVHEEEQIRAEEETLAEIQRLQSRSDSAISPAVGLAVNILSNMVALAAVAFALFTYLNATSGSNGPTNLQAILTHPVEIGVLAAILVLLVALYWFIQQAFARRLHATSVSWRHIRRGEGRYYYEFDIHLDEAMDHAAAQALLEGRIEPKSGRRGAPIGAATLAGSAVETDPVHSAIPNIAGNGPRAAFGPLERNSYRVERISSDEALHKIYMETNLQLDLRKWWQVHARSMRVVLVYEVLFHRPAMAHSSVLRDLRVVSTHHSTLTTELIAIMKRQIMDQYINPLLTQTQLQGATGTQPLTGTPRPFDSLLSLSDSPVDRVQISEPERPSALRLAWLTALVYLLGLLVSDAATVSAQARAGAFQGAPALLHLFLLDELAAIVTQMPATVLIAPLLLALALFLSVVGNQLQAHRAQDHTAQATNPAAPEATAATRSHRRVGLAAASLGIGILGAIGSIPVVVNAFVWIAAHLH